MNNPETNSPPLNMEEEFKNYLHWVFKDLATKTNGNSEAGFSQFTFYKVTLFMVNITVFSFARVSEQADVRGPPTLAASNNHTGLGLKSSLRRR